MLNILIAPDSFKGTLAALPAAQAIADGIRQVLPQARVQIFPMADGGEGTLDAILYALPGERRNALVADALGMPIRADYAVLNAAPDAIAVLEAAQVVGLNQAGQSDVTQRSTFGLGELLRHCLDQGLRRFMIGLGGSSTNDGGAGLLAALGVKLCDASGAVIAPNPQGLAALHHIAWDALDPRLAQCEITLLTDVDNPLCGAEGATAIFGPQKGVRADDVPLIDSRLQGLAQLGDAWAGRALSLEPGFGCGRRFGLCVAVVRGSAACGWGGSVRVHAVGCSLGTSRLGDYRRGQIRCANPARQIAVGGGATCAARARAGDFIVRHDRRRQPRGLGASVYSLLFLGWGRCIPGVGDARNGQLFAYARATDCANVS